MGKEMNYLDKQSTRFTDLEIVLQILKKETVRKLVRILFGCSSGLLLVFVRSYMYALTLELQTCFSPLLYCECTSS